MSITGRSRILGPLPEDQSDYWRVFRRQVFWLLKMGYQCLDAKNFKDSEEPDITGELVKETRKVIDECTQLKWARPYVVYENPPANKPGILGKRRPILDIELELTQRRPHPRYAFEAKRLSAGSHPVGKYCGNEGLGKFLCGDYAHDRDEAGMLGYVQSNSPEEWAQKLRKKFKDDATSLLVSPGGELLHANDTAGWTHCCHSKHQRPSISKPITLYHILLVFC